MMNDEATIKANMAQLDFLYLNGEVDDSIRGTIQSKHIKSKAYEMLTEAGKNVEDYTHWEVVEAQGQFGRDAADSLFRSVWAKVKVREFKRDPEVLKMIEGGEKPCAPMFIASVLVHNKETDTALDVVVVCEDGHEKAFTLGPSESETVEVIREEGTATFYRPIKSMRTRISKEPWESVGYRTRTGPTVPTSQNERGPKEGWISRELGPVTQYIKNLPVVLDKEGGDLKADPTQKAFEPELFVHVKILETQPIYGGAVPAWAALPQVLDVAAPKTKAHKLDYFS